MVEFGRVIGIVEPSMDLGATALWLTVTLETKDAVTVVRDQKLEPVLPVLQSADLAWHADQWTQETIGVDLAEQGWEVLGMTATESDTAGGPPHSATYTVRRLFLPLQEAAVKQDDTQ